MQETSTRCRLCLAPSKKMIDIFDRTGKLNVSDLISEIFNIEVKPDDKLTKKICQNCLEILDYICISRQNFQLNQKMLLECDTKKNGIIIANSIKKNSNGLKNLPVLMDEHIKRSSDDYVKIKKPDLLSLCQARVAIPFHEELLVLQKLRGKNIKYKRRRPKLKSNRKLNKAINIYHNMKTSSIRDLIKEKLECDNNRKRSFHEDESSFKLAVERRHPLCSIERWKMSTDEDLEINMELNVFTCTVCKQMFNTKWNLRIHEQTHQNVVLKHNSNSPRSNSSSPLTII